MSEANKPGNSNYHIRLPLVLFAGLAIGLLVGANLHSTQNPISFSGGAQKFREVVGLIRNEYVDETDTDALVEDAIEEMLSQLDPHSSYIPASDRIAANEDLMGTFEGIGIEFNIFHDTIVVVTPLSGGPSEAVGLRSGDKIIKVDGENVASINITNTDVMRYLKGPKGSQVVVTVRRKNTKEPLAFTITRDRIPQYSVEGSYMIDREIGYIKVNRFSQTTFDEFKVALENLKEAGMTQLILDLQGNPGGYMNQAIDLADEFLTEGKKIVFTKGQDTRYNTEAFATSKGDFENGNLIILVSEGSASASEIVAGALQDNDRALIVGRRTFGKGLVQSPFNLNDGSELRLTISRYYTPSGRSIQKPYNDNTAYAEDLTQRFKHGEFFTADSVKFNDSLKYQTLSGRAVYGGGGIMPDYFVPLDTLRTSEYLNRLYNSNSIQEYTFNYVERSKKRLEEMGLSKFQQDFTVTDEMINNLMALGEANRVAPDRADLAKHKNLIQLHVKALIARKLWNNDGYLPIINTTNEILQQAIKLFDKVPNLNRGEI